MNENGRPRSFDHELARSMYRVDGLTYSEIGRRFGVTHAAVRKAVSLLERDDPTPPGVGPVLICVSPECSNVVPPIINRSRIYCCAACRQRARYLSDRDRHVRRVRRPVAAPKPIGPIFTPWPSSCKPVPQRDDLDDPLPTNGNAIGHVTRARKMRSERGTAPGPRA